jgi:hypothetical protein
MQVALLWQEPLDLLHSTALFVICISLMRLNTAISYMAIQETYYHLLPNILTSSFYNLCLAAGVNTSFIIRILTCVHLLRILSCQSLDNWKLISWWHHVDNSVWNIAWVLAIRPCWALLKRASDNRSGLISKDIQQTYWINFNLINVLIELIKWTWIYEIHKKINLGISYFFSLWIIRLHLKIFNKESPARVHGKPKALTSPYCQLK